MALSIDSNASLNPAAVPPPSLLQGSAGTAVRQLQQKLADAGFSPGGVDGKFGPNTARAVRSFQAAQKLPQTGSMDAATSAALQAAPTAIQRRLSTDSFQPGGSSSVSSATTSPRAGETVNARELAITSSLAKRPDLQPRGGVTHCNQFAQAYATQMLGNTAQVQNLFSGNAHQQYENLASAARSGNGVREVSAAQAGQLAASGKTVVVATSTLSSGGHGHIAAVIGTAADGSIRTGQAGTTNYGDGPLSTRFTGGAAKQAHYYVIG